MKKDSQEAFSPPKEDHKKLDLFSGKGVSLFFLSTLLFFFFPQHLSWRSSRDPLPHPSLSSSKDTSFQWTLKKTWERELKSRPVSSPIIVQDLIVILHESGQLEAFHQTKGSIRWVKGPFLDAKILGARKDFIIVQSGKTVMGIKAEDGQRAWEIDLNSRTINASIIDETSFALLIKNLLYRMKIFDGSLQKIDNIDLPLKKDNPFVFDGRRYIALVHDSRSILLYDLKRKKIKWRFQGGAKISLPPLLQKGVLYIFSEDHFIYALKLKNGHQIFRQKMENKLRYSPASGEGFFLVAPWASRNIYMVDSSTGVTTSLFSLDSDRYHFVNALSYHKDRLAATYSDFFSEKVFLIVFKLEKKGEEG